MASFVFKNIGQNNRMVPCELYKGAGRKIIIHPEHDGGPAIVMDIYKDGDLETPLVKSIDRMRYFNSYHKFVERGTGKYICGFYCFYLSDEHFDEFMAIPEFANLPYDIGITEEDWLNPASKKKVPEAGEFCIASCDSDEEAYALYNKALSRD